MKFLRTYPRILNFFNHRKYSKAVGLKNTKADLSSAIKDEKNVFNKETFFNNLMSNPTLLSLGINEDIIVNLKKYVAVSKNKTTTLFSVSDSVARDIVDKVLNGVESKHNVIYEVNPGLGLITHFLIQSNVNKITIVEKKSLGTPLVNNLCSRYENKIKRIDCNLLQLGGLSYDVIKQFFNSGNQESEVNKVIMISPAIKLFTNVVYAVLFKSLSNALRNAEFFIVADQKHFNNFKNYGQRSIKLHTYCMLNLFFKATVLQEFSRNDFYPFSKDNHKMFLIHVKPNENVYDKVKEKNLILFYVFLKMIGKSKLNFILPTLEQWWPGCGLILISKGLTVFTQIRDLSLDEFIVLFDILKENDKSLKFLMLLKQFYSTSLKQEIIVDTEKIVNPNT